MHGPVLKGFVLFPHPKSFLEQLNAISKGKGELQYSPSGDG